MCYFRKGFRIQQAHVSFSINLSNTFKATGSKIEKTEAVLDRNRFIGVVLMDLSRLFANINHDRLISKLNAYDFTKDSLKFIKKLPF